MRVARTETWFVPIICILVGTAWAALWLWEQSPYGRYLDHGHWTEIGLAAEICRALPAGDLLVPGLLYAGGWGDISSCGRVSALRRISWMRDSTRPWPDSAGCCSMAGCWAPSC